MLTKQQADLLAYIDWYISDHGGISPSFDEMRRFMGLKSKSGIARLIGALEQRGKIRRLPHLARAIEVVSGSRAPERSSVEQKLTLALDHFERGDLTAALHVTRDAAQVIEQSLAG